jgi:hypothetical protein
MVTNAGTWTWWSDAKQRHAVEGIMERLSEQGCDVATLEKLARQRLDEKKK